MNIDTNKLKENQVQNFEETLHSVDLDLDTNEVKYKGSIKISTEAKKEMYMLYTKTHFSASAEFSCSLCLKQYSDAIERDFDIKYLLDKSEQSINITKDIREEIISNYPVKFLCTSDCRGLCFKCGKSLNEGECRCSNKKKER